MNESILIDGKSVPELQPGTIECNRVVIIPGKLINIVTKTTYETDFIRFVQNEDGTKTVEGAGATYQQYLNSINA